MWLPGNRSDLDLNMDNFDQDCVNACKALLEAGTAASDRIHWPAKMYVALNIFLSHLDIFDSSEDPRPAFAKLVQWGADFVAQAAGSAPMNGRFPTNNETQEQFETRVSGLFSDIWVGMSDDIYFDESYQFTKERLEKNGYSGEALFKDKVVLDGGCGSGKFSVAIARFGAQKVIGLDLGAKGLEFARAQARKVPFGDRVEYVHGSLLDIPLPDNSVDFVWSNGVIHHTTGYDKCVSEFARVLKPGGQMFLYVNGHYGLFELLLDTLRLFMQNVPRQLYLQYQAALGINSGRIYWITDCTYAPYEWRSDAAVQELLRQNGFTDIVRLRRGVDSDAAEKLAIEVPYAEVKYGEGQLKYIATVKK